MPRDADFQDQLTIRQKLEGMAPFRDDAKSPTEFFIERI